MALCLYGIPTALGGCFPPPEDPYVMVFKTDRGVCGTGAVTIKLTFLSPKNGQVPPGKSYKTSIAERTLVRVCFP